MMTKAKVFKIELIFKLSRPSPRKGTRRREESLVINNPNCTELNHNFVSRDQPPHSVLKKRF